MSQASTIVTPITLANIDANSSNTGILASSARTLQFDYASSVLGLKPGDVLTGMAFRLNAGASGAFGALTFSNYDIELSSTAAAPGSLNTTFDANLGADAVVVRSGALNISSNSFPSGQSPNFFGYQFVFSNNFTYTGGNLLVTIRHTGNTSGATVPLDTASPSPTAPLWQSQGALSYNAVASAAGVINTSPVIAFQVQPFVSIPEPATALLVPGLLGLFLLVRNRRSRAGEMHSC